MNDNNNRKKKLALVVFAFDHMKVTNEKVVQKQEKERKKGKWHMLCFAKLRNSFQILRH